MFAVFHYKCDAKYEPVMHRATKETILRHLTFIRLLLRDEL